MKNEWVCKECESNGVDCYFSSTSLAIKHTKATGHMTVRVYRRVIL